MKYGSFILGFVITFLLPIIVVVEARKHETVQELTDLHHPMYRTEPVPRDEKDDGMHDRMLQAGCEERNIGVYMSE